MPEGRVAQEGLGIKPTAVVGNLQSHFGLAHPQGDVDVLGAGVASDVRQRFLQDPIDRQLDRWRHADAGIRGIERDVNCRALAEAADVRLHCGNETEVIENGRAQQLREIAHALEHSPDLLSRLAHLGVQRTVWQ